VTTVNDENDENRKLRELLSRMREEADEARRNVDPKSVLRYGAKRDRQLLDEVEALLGPRAWDALDSATHIEWGDQAICHWTLYPPTRWPSSQKAVKIADLIARLPCEDDETFVEFVARPDPSWNGVTCDDCRVRLPTLLRQLSVILDDLQEGIIEGHRTHPQTKLAYESYLRHVEPKLMAEQRARYAEQTKAIESKDARRAARRARMQGP
jgi:hypothetical protein